MKQPRSQRLRRVADLATRETDEAATTMGERIRELDQAQQQLKELEQFRREYAQIDPQAQGVSVQQLLNRQNFVARIDQAIVQQHRVIEFCTRRVNEARSAWLEARNHSAALDTVAQRYRDKERASEDRLEQSLIDERMQHRKPPHGNDH